MLQVIRTFINALYPTVVVFADPTDGKTGVAFDFEVEREPERVVVFFLLAYPYSIKMISLDTSMCIELIKSTSYVMPGVETFADKLSTIHNQCLPLVLNCKAMAAIAAANKTQLVCYFYFMTY